MYHISFLSSTGLLTFPFNGCNGRAATSTFLPVKFLLRHVRDTVIIVEEVNLSYPRCPHCNVVVPWLALNVRHPNTSQCAKGVERKRRRMAAEDIQEITKRDFCAYVLPLTPLPSLN